MSERSSARSYRFHPHAEIEIVDEVEYLKADNPDDPLVAQRFQLAVDRAIGRMLQHPQIGKVIFERRGRRIRRWRVRGFRYSLVYAVPGDIVHILAVAHHRRKPGYWLYRLRTS